MYHVHVSCIMYHVSCIMYPASCIMYHVSCIMYHVSCIMYHVSCIMYHVSCIYGFNPPPQRIKEWSYITVCTDQTINQKMSKITNWTISWKYKSLYFRAEPKHQNIKGFKRSKVNSNLKNKLSNIFGGAGREGFVF